LLGGTLVTPEAILSMVPFLVSPETAGRIKTLATGKAQVAVLMIALKCRFVLMFGPDVALEGLVFAETLVTRREISASESFLAFVN
jgi:hypothetical protein